MFAGLAAKLGLQVAFALMKQYWKPIAVIVGVLAILGYIAYLRWDNASLETDLSEAKHNYAVAAEANKENVKAITKLNRNAAVDRQIQALELERTEKASNKMDAIRKELNELPDANVRVNAHRDELAKRLRELDGN